MKTRSGLYALVTVILVLSLSALACGSATSTPKAAPTATQASQEQKLTPTNTPKGDEPAEEPTAEESTAEKPMATPAPATTPSPTSTGVPTALSTPALKGAATTGVNLRAGPGTNYAKVGGLAVGDQIEILHRTGDGEWYQVRLKSGALAWVAAAYISTDIDPGILPTIAPANIPPTSAAPAATPTSVATPTSAATPTSVATPTSAPQPTATPRPVCDCSGDLYNCKHFRTHADAQACYNYCKSLGRGDIHRLDRDKDGLACESLP